MTLLRLVPVAVIALAACTREPAEPTGAAATPPPALPDPPVAEAPAAAPAAAERKTHTTTGVVKSVEGDRVTIAHEDVPGYMNAMTMPFFADDAALLEGLAEGDAVEFTFAEPSGSPRHVLVSITEK